MVAARPGEAIEAALREVAALLEASEIIAATAAVDRLGAACRAAAQNADGDGNGIDELTRTRLAPLVERCTALAAQTNTRLAAALSRLGTSNRAYRAYNAD